MKTDDLLPWLDDLFSRFGSAFDAALTQVEAAPGGVHLLCRTEFPGYGASVRQGLAVSQPQARSDCRILVARPQTLGLDSQPVWGEAFYRERAVEAALATTRYRLHHMPEIGFWQAYDRQTGRGIQIMPDAESLPQWENGSPLRNFWHWHLSAADRALIHAGSLGIGGRGVLLSGAGGAGKSGTVLAGVLAGLDTVGDDYLLVSVGRPVRAEPLFNTLKTDPGGHARLGLARFPEVPRALNWQGKHQFTLADIGARARPEGLEIYALCLPEIGGGETRLEPVGAKEAFLAMAPSGVSQIPGDRDRSFAVAAALARSLPTYRLRLGPDPVEIARALSRFIEALSD